MGIIKIEENEIRLNSGIAEENFGKMSYAQIITEKGTLIKGTKTGDTYEFDYDTWAFDDVQAFDEDSSESKSDSANRKVFYCGKVPFFSNDATTLLDALESENAFNAGYAFMQLLTDIAKQKREIALIGAGGIIIEFDKSENVTILILPKELFTYSIAGLSAKEKAVLDGWWMNPTLKGIQACRFMRAVIAYKVLTGHVPYPATDVIERNADILDEKFLPLEYCIKNINLNFSDRITDELILNAASVTIPGKKQKKSIAEKLKDTSDSKKEIPKNEEAKEKFFSDSYFKSITEFPFDQFTKEAQHKTASPVSDEEFEQNAREYLKKQEKRVKTKRVIRRNVTKIVVIAIISVSVILLIGNSIKSTRENETSKGLTTEQTVEAYFKAMNTLNATLASAVTKGRSATRYADVISQIYVMGKNRQAYDKEEGFLNPAAYFIYTTEQKKIGKSGVYGATNLKINGKESNIDIVPYRINQKPQPITAEGGTEIYNKMQKAVRADYYEIHTEANEIIVEAHNDIFILTYFKNQWLITEIQQHIEEINVNEESLYKKYFSALEENSGNQIDALNAIRAEYSWLPKEKVVLNEMADQQRKEAEFRGQYGL